jgi:hypothetical protein
MDPCLGLFDLITKSGEGLQQVEIRVFCKDGTFKTFPGIKRHGIVYAAKEAIWCRQEFDRTEKYFDVDSRRKIHELARMYFEVPVCQFWYNYNIYWLGQI